MALSAHDPYSFFSSRSLCISYIVKTLNERNLSIYNFVLIIAGISKSQEVYSFFVLWLLRIKVKINFIMIKEVIKLLKLVKK